MLFVANVVGAPSADKVEAAHDKKFCQALEEIFDKYKHGLGYSDQKLEIDHFAWKRTYLKTQKWEGSKDFGFLIAQWTTTMGDQTILAPSIVG